MKAWKHFCTITHHKNLVMVGCFKIGLYWQGLLHDLSKYGPTEFLVGCKYYKGYMSPNNAERKEKGLSTAWLHHKGRNKHHLEYWIDYGVPDSKDGNSHKGMEGMKMPIRYVAEMVIDRIAASKNYQKDKYKDDSAWKYYVNGMEAHMIHKDTRALLEFLLVYVAVYGENATYSYMKKELMKGKVPYEKEKLVEMRDDLLKEHPELTIESIKASLESSMTE